MPEDAENASIPRKRRISIPINMAEKYRLYDLDRLEKMVLREIAHDYFVLALGPEDDHD